MSQSPFTFDQQVYQHQGVVWEAEITLPPLKQSDAKAVEAFLARCRGMKETFMLGNPLHNIVATGAITSASVGDTTVTGTLTGAGAGDYFQLGNHLYIITALGSGEFEIMPPIRDAVSVSTSLDFTLPQGEWRLATNEVNWSINEASIYGFTFPIIEAL
jgi:hypothetical protein